MTLSLTFLTLAVTLAVTLTSAAQDRRAVDYYYSDDYPEIFQDYDGQEKTAAIGCLYTDGLCNQEYETCFDDNLFGRCVSADDDDEQFIRFPSDLDSGSRVLLTSVLDRLSASGLGWDDTYSQCVLTFAEDAIKYQDAGLFDESRCFEYLPTDIDVGDDGDDVGEEELAEELEMMDGLPTSVVPKKMIRAGEDRDQEQQDLMLPYPGDDGYYYYYESSSSDENPLVTVVEEEERMPNGEARRDILIQPDTQGLLDTYGAEISPLMADDDANGSTDIMIPDEIEDVDQDEDEEEIILPEFGGGMTLPQMNLATYLAMKNAVDNAILEESGAPDELVIPDPAGGEEVIMEIPDQNMQEEQQEYLPVVRKVGKRGGEGRAEYIVPDYYDLLPNEGTPVDYYYYDMDNEGGRGEEEEEEQVEEDNSNNGNFVGVIARARGGGLGSNIFNRNERLDVKKPGPFFKNSANNFFLDKLSSSEKTTSSEGNGEKEEKKSSDVGQVEYEMPLLAPTKDKRLLPVEEEVKEEERKDRPYVHIALKKRLNTWGQGFHFIERLAEEFGLPKQALTNRRIDNQHVQFHVDANPGSVTAHQMAKRIASDGDLRSRLDEDVGVQIDRVAAGPKDDGDALLFPGGASLNLLLATVMAASTAAALIVVGLVALVVGRRRRRISRKELLLGGEETAQQGQQEYKQLCRDWSRSSKKGSATASPGVHQYQQVQTAGVSTQGQAQGQQQQQQVKQVRAQDSKESNRSSTSSWPEEPSTANMDISTGHMVLAYMEDHLRNKQRLEQEWVALCAYEAEPSTTDAAFRADNKKKNRYPDKLPYDHNRVMLNAVVNGGGSDYINASTVTDSDPRNPSYIVAQAPLANTVADFWQMIWEQGCVVIVMLTELSENGHQFCHRYWPEEGSEQYHIFEVHLVSEHVWCADYLVRSVYLKNTRSGETRTVTQFHFRSWPAHGAPSSTRALLEFRRKVNKSYRGRSCPVLVHCSDGVGRSGTYVLIDMVLNRMAKGCKEIDIAATLEHVRDQRGGMVQTRQQFEFCLMAVAEEVHAILKALPQ